MSKYTPDRWVIVKISKDGNEIIRKVFGTWLGDYADGDSWRISSGITNIEEDEDGYVLHIHNESGSVYHVNKNCQGTSSYTASVLRSMIESVTDQGYTMEVVDEWK